MLQAELEKTMALLNSMKELEATMAQFYGEGKKAFPSYGVNLREDISKEEIMHSENIAKMAEIVSKKHEAFTANTHILKNQNHEEKNRYRKMLLCLCRRMP